MDLSNPFASNTFYRARVEEIEKDETKTGRVRVRLLGYMDTVPVDRLPWADRACPYTPNVGDIVWVFLEANDPMQPVYIYKSFHQTGSGEDDKVNHYRERKAGKIKNKIDSNKATGVQTGYGSWNEVGDSWDAKYPYNSVFSVGDIVIEVDETDNSKRVHIYHPSGSRVEINNDGKIDIHGKDDLYLVTKNNLRIFAQNEVSLTGKDVRVYSSTGDISLKNNTCEVKVSNKVLLKGISVSLKQILSDLIDQIKSIVTVGSATTQTVSPASQAALEAVKQTEVIPNLD